MDKYYINYDLRNQRNYKKLHDELEKWGAITVLESLWCLTKNNTTVKEIRDHFEDYIDEDDGLIVIKSTGSAWKNVDNKPSVLG